MANVTMTLYEIINNFYSRNEVEEWFKNYELSDYLTPEQIAVINEHGTWSKNKLAKKIVDRYLMKEIGFETMALFKHNIKVSMEQIMEEKLPLIYTASIDYDLLTNVDYTETFSRDVNQEGQTSSGGSTSGTSNSGTNSSGITVNSQTPQGQITKQNVLAGDYASSVTASENEAHDEEITHSETMNEVSQDNQTKENYIKK